MRSKEEEAHDPCVALCVLCASVCRESLPGKPLAGRDCASSQHPRRSLLLNRIILNLMNAPVKTRAAFMKRIVSQKDQNTQSADKEIHVKVLKGAILCRIQFAVAF